jgi:hypothetical protein
VLDQIIDQSDGADSSQLQGKQVIKGITKKKLSKNTKDISDKNSNAASLTLKEQADDFFNSFIPALQQKAKPAAAAQKTAELSVSSKSSASNLSASVSAQQ